jgi:peptidoglycan/LPS O-acetylase OafA/YrhL
MADEIISLAMISLFMFSLNSKCSWLRFSHPLLVFLGKISYGIYLFHMFAIVIAVKIVIQFNDQDSVIQFSILSVLTIIISILLGFLSYEYFEKPILRYKKNYIR